jgi:hypothetical protein
MTIKSLDQIETMRIAPQLAIQLLDLWSCAAS